VAEEPRVVPETPARDESSANEEIAVAPDERPFVVEFGELADDAFDRLERGLDAPRPPLITSNAGSRGRWTTPLVPSPAPWQTSTPCEPSYVVENVEPTCVRRDREPKSKLAIFRRFVNMIGKKEEQNAPRRAETSEPVEPSDNRSGIDYGETVAFAVAPSFPDAETFCSDACPLTPQ
ncbi:MAG: hypothetical protein IKX88_10975, partial [Thermoguttaceae bacterium]|nr:hypothetical protein [Thermoguttaceae bacterium]